MSVGYTSFLMQPTDIIFFFIRRLTSFGESFGLLNDVFPFYTVLGTGCPIFNF
jgi:hypothetical protein